LDATISGGDLRLYAFLRVLATTGMRRGEACGLRWSDLEDDGTLNIDESVVVASGAAIVKSPKTRISVRKVAIDKRTVEILLDLRKSAEGLAEMCGVNLTPNSFMFSFNPGGIAPPYPDSMSHAFSKLRTKHGFATDIHLHSFRHFQATLIDPHTSERQKQSRLGWSTAHMARHYTDAIESEDIRVARIVGDMLD